MLEDHRYFFNALKSVFFASIAAAILSGCSITAHNNKQGFKSDNRGFFEKLKKADRKGNVDAAESHVVAIDPTQTSTTGLRLTEKSKQSVEAFDIKPSSISRIDVDTNSAACRFLRKSADSEAIIIGSPTLSASSDEDGSGSVSIGMNLLDLRKSDLIRASGDAKCRLHEATKKIEATLGLGAEATRFARNWAKQDYLRKHLGEMQNISKRASGYVQQGMMTTQDATRVRTEISVLRSEMEAAKAKASLGQNLPAITPNDVRSRHGALIEATNDLQNIEREIRTNDALELSLSAGYRYNDEFNNDLQRSANAGGFARINVGIRLGALTSRRNTLEEEAAGARLDTLFEENAGTVWKSGFSERAINRMLKDLKKSEAELDRAMIRAKQTIAKLEEDEDQTTLSVKLSVKIEIIRIGANRAEVRAAIKQLQNNQKNIQALSE